MIAFMNHFRFAGTPVGFETRGGGCRERAPREPEPPRGRCLPQGSPAGATFPLERHFGPHARGSPTAASVLDRGLSPFTDSGRGGLLDLYLTPPSLHPGPREG